jgi:hypothetical protein
MQFQVPQFIETEDKIVGPLSLRQFIYVGVGVGISALFYFILQTWLAVILGIIFIGGALAISFVKVQGRPLVNVLVSAFNFYWKPQTYVWQSEQQQAEKAKAPAEKPRAATLEKIAAGMALHKSWQNIQTGEKISAKQFTEQKMYGRYQIFQKKTGDREAARRVDYR